MEVGQVERGIFCGSARGGLAHSDGEDGAVGDDDIVEQSADTEESGSGKDAPGRVDWKQHDGSCREKVDGTLEG